MLLSLRLSNTEIKYAPWTYYESNSQVDCCSTIVIVKQCDFSIHKKVHSSSNLLPPAGRDRDSNPIILFIIHSIFRRDAEQQRAGQSKGSSRGSSAVHFRMMRDLCEIFGHDTTERWSVVCLPVYVFKSFTERSHLPNRALHPLVDERWDYEIEMSRSQTLVPREIRLPSLFGTCMLYVLSKGFLSERYLFPKTRQ